jgi:hypothetical protein
MIQAQLSENKIESADINKRVKGIYFNTRENLCSFTLSEPGDKMGPLAGTGTGIDLNDLAVALFVFYNEAVQSKNISFSLDALDEKNPEGDF